MAEDLLPTTPSGGQVGYDPVLNSTPILPRTEGNVTAGTEILRGVDAPTYIGEESRRVNIPTVLE